MGAELEGSLAHDARHCLLERRQPLSKVCGQAAPTQSDLGAPAGLLCSSGDSSSRSEPRKTWSFSGKGQVVMRVG